jgi:hypothetical protein
VLDLPKTIGLVEGFQLTQIEEDGFFAIPLMKIGYSRACRVRQWITLFL